MSTANATSRTAVSPVVLEELNVKLGKRANFEFESKWSTPRK